MAEHVFLFLKAGGSDIQGESTITSQGRENSIECYGFNSEVQTSREATTGLSTGRRIHLPIRISKKIDKSSPLILKALTTNQAIEGTFKFFRANPSGDGTSQHYYSVNITNARVASVKQLSEVHNDTKDLGLPALEEITFVFQDIRWTYEEGGVEHNDSWKEMA